LGYCWCFRVVVVDKLFLVLGCSVFVVLGGIHFYLTMFTNKFEARESRVTSDMARVSPILTSRTSMWKAWIGFNISHSLGAIVFGLVYVIIALENYDYLKTSTALNVLLLVVPLILLMLAVRYWFNKPRNGILVGFGLILISLVLRTIPQ
jgi:hypothetical protein